MPTDAIFFIDLAARSAVVLSIAWGAVIALPKLPSAARYWIWLMALCALPLLPLTTAAIPGITLFDLSAKAGADEAAAAVVPITAAAEPVAPVAAVVPMIAGGAPFGAAEVSALTLPPPPAAAPAEERRWTGATAIYGVGVGVLLLPLCAGLLRLRLLRQGALAPRDSALAGEIQLAFRDGTLGRRTRVLISPDVTIPLTWGTLCPIILLPANASAWPRERLRVVLAHEAAHIVRRDFASGLVSSLLRAAFWFQPLVWLAHRRLRVEREIACDDRVLLSSTPSAPDYAEHLSEVVRAGIRRQPAAAIAMAKPSEFVGRVRAILDSARDRSAISRRGKGRVVLLAAVLLCPLVFVRCAGEKSAGSTHETGIGSKLKAVDPSAITITWDGVDVEVPGGKKFWMAEREVTQAEFEQLLGHNPSSTKAEHLPVDRVTRTEAAMFCKVLTERDRAAGKLAKGKVYRLPTRREWLLAALPGGLVPAGESLDAIAWHEGNSAGQVNPVAAKTANAYGLHDVLGNVAEWADPDPLMGAAAAGGGGRYLGRAVLLLNAPAGGAREGENAAADAYSTFAQTQVALVTSRTTLASVVAELDLMSRWKLATEAEAVARLRAGLNVRMIRGTELMEVGYYAETGEEAAEIANKVSARFKGLTDEQWRAAAATQLQVLQIEVAQQEALMEDSRAQLLELMEKSGVVDLSMRSPAWMVGGGGVQTDHATGSDQSVGALRATLDSLEELEGGALIKAAAGLGLGNPLMSTRYPEYETAILEEKTMRDAGLAENNPKVLAAREMVTSLERMLLEAAEATKKTLATQLQLAEESEADAENARLQKAEDKLDDQRRSIEYLAAKDEYQLHKTLLSEMRQRIAIEAVNLKMPRSSVTIVELAEPRLTASKPRPDAPSAVGGSVADRGEDLLDSATSTRADERTTGVGFRFVMADE